MLAQGKGYVFFFHVFLGELIEIVHCLYFIEKTILFIVLHE